MNPENISFSVEEGINLHYGRASVLIAYDIDGFKIFAEQLRIQMNKIVEEIEENY